MIPTLPPNKKMRLQEVRASRSASSVQQALEDLRRAAAGTDNLMPHFINCARQYATLGEMCDVLRSVFGTYTEPHFLKCGARWKLL